MQKSFLTLFLFQTLIFSLHGQILKENCDLPSNISSLWNNYNRGGLSGDFTDGNDFLDLANAIIVGGTTLSTSGHWQPAVRKIDTLGNLIWTTSTYSDDKSTGYVDLILADTNKNIYATVVDYDNRERGEIWKINSNTGEILWKTEIHPITREIDLLKDYNDSLIIASYSSEYDGLGHHIQLAFLRKSNGTIKETKSLGFIRWTFDQYIVHVDNQKSLYLSKEDSVFKFGSAPGLPLIWKKLVSSVDVGDYQKMIEENDTLYVFGRTERSEKGIVTSFTSNGVTLYSTILSGTPSYEFSSADVGEITSDEKNFYISLDPLVTTQEKIRICKIKKSDGKLEWAQLVSFWLWDEFVNSMVISDQDELILTGRAGASFDRKWGVMRINTSNGTVIETDTIPNGKIGIGALKRNGSIYLIGDYKNGTSGFVKNPGANSEVFTIYDCYEDSIDKPTDLTALGISSFDIELKWQDNSPPPGLCPHRPFAKKGL